MAMARIERWIRRSSLLELGCSGRTAHQCPSTSPEGQQSVHPGAAELLRREGDAGLARLEAWLAIERRTEIAAVRN